jgi:AcrR family transcriptional regulator
MGYTVELSSDIATMHKPTIQKAKPRAKRGTDKSAILDAAFDMLSKGGEEGFSVRKLGQSVGVDPMTVLHHFGSKDELLRHVADHALTTVKLPRPSDDWRSDLNKVAHAYRDLAHRHPRLFHLHFRFHATGPIDHASSEVVYRAMRRVGLSDADAAGLGLAFYAFVLGFALAEAEGLLRPISNDDEAELSALDPDDCAATLALVPAFKALDRDAAFDAAINAFIAGVFLLRCPVVPVASPQARAGKAGRAEGGRRLRAQ